MNKNGKKGVVLFVVEGISDKISLSLPMTGLLCSDRVQFAVMHGDCLNRTDGRTLAILQGCIHDICVKYNYRKSDFTHIIHIIDTDGSFIPDEKVIPSRTSGTEYYSDRIITGEYTETVTRHHRRRAMAQRLSQVKTIMNIPYDVYYMSRNLEHVTQGDDGRVSSNHKVSYAEKFADKYAEDIYGFMEFLYAEKVAAKGDYETSWKHIFSGTNSLKRETNLNFFLEQYYDNLYAEN